MSCVAVITRPGQTQFLAGISNVRCSGWDSYLTGQQASTAMHIARWVWDWGDGTPNTEGPEVAHRYATAGAKTITLTVTADDGSTDSDTSSVTYKTLAATFNKFVKAAGSDAADGAGNATAYATLEKAYSVWRATLPRASADDWGLIQCRGGDTITFSGLNDGTHSPNPDYGPLIVLNYNTGGGHAIIACDDGTDFSMGENNHDTSWDNPVYFNGIDIAYATAQDGSGGAGGATVYQSHKGGQVENCVITRAPFKVLGAASDAFWMSGSTVRLAGDVGIGAANGNDYHMITGCTAYGNGTDGSFDHQMYFTSADHVGVYGGMVDQVAATAFSGIKTSGCTKIYVRGTTIKRCKVAADVGANLGEEVTDVLYENVILDACVETGFWMNFLQRFQLRNLRVLGGISNELFYEASYTGAYNADTVTILGSSIYDIGGKLFNLNTNFFRSFVFKGNIVQKDLGSGYFVECAALADLDEFDSDYNLYFLHSGATAGSTGQFHVGASSHNFTQWLATDGQDAHSVWGNPLFTGAASGDLRVASTSPAVNAGVALGLLIVDVSGTARPQGTDYDIGAFDQVGVVDTEDPVVDITTPTDGSTVSGTIAISADATDNVAVVGVQFQVDGVDEGSEDTSAPYSINWDTTGVSGGIHTLSAIARDAAGNTATDSVDVVVNNDPPPEEPSPPGGGGSGADYLALGLPSARETIRPLRAGGPTFKKGGPSRTWPPR